MEEAGITQSRGRVRWAENRPAGSMEAPVSHGRVFGGCHPDWAGSFFYFPSDALEKVERWIHS